MNAPQININARTITLKSFKTVKWMSEETICFTAAVLIDGKVVGEASNEGHGGSTFVRFIGENRLAVEEAAEALAKEAKPADFKGWEFLGDKGFNFADLIDILVERHANAASDAKFLKKIRKDAVEKLMFLTNEIVVGSGQSRSFKKVPNEATRLACIAHAKAKPDFKCFVSDMTDAEIFAHFAV